MKNCILIANFKYNFLRDKIMKKTVDYNKITIKTPAEIAMLRIAGRIAAQVLQDLSPHIVPGVTSLEISEIARELIINKYGCELDREDLAGYDSSKFSAISIAHNDIAFSGEPNNLPLKKGDLFGVDVSLKKNGWCGDTQRMWIVGDETSSHARHLVNVGYQAMCLGISLVKPGVKLQDIAKKVQAHVESFGFNMLRVPSGTGHSIGQVHADGWLIPFYDDPMGGRQVHFCCSNFIKK